MEKSGWVPNMECPGFDPDTEVFDSSFFQR